MGKLAKSKRGGKRENAGRPTPDKAQSLKRKTVMLDDATVDKATGIGEGNLSAGIRIAVKRSSS